MALEDIREFDHPVQEEGLYDFEKASEFLLEEQKEQIQEQIERLRSELGNLMNVPNSSEFVAKKAEITQLEERLGILGGDTRTQTRKVLERYNPERDSAWFLEGFQEIEAMFMSRIIHELADRFEISPLQLKVDDRGVGTGRSLKMLYGLIEKDFGKVAAGLFARNLYGIDLIESHISESREALGGLGVPTENLQVGDYLNIPRQETVYQKPGQFHLILSMLHSSFHNVTEKQWMRFFQEIEKDLTPATASRPGGFLVLDTVKMPRSKPGRVTEDDKAHLNDLKNLYPLLWYIYCQRHQDKLPLEVNLRKMPRRTIEDNTTGVGFYVREVPRRAYIQHLLDKIGGLTVKSAMTVQPKFSQDDNANKHRATEIGRRWIKENELADVLKSIIRRRIQIGLVNPKELIPDMESTQEEVILEGLLEHVGMHMALGYSNEYIVIERTSYDPNATEALSDDPIKRQMDLFSSGKKI